MNRFPFTEDRTDGVIFRKFSRDVDDEELTWHRDMLAREVHVVESRGWYLQFDDELPQELNAGKKYFIPAKSWHRVIKKSNCDDLLVEIREMTE